MPQKKIKNKKREEREGSRKRGTEREGGQKQAVRHLREAGQSDSMVHLSSADQRGLRRVCTFEPIHSKFTASHLGLPAFLLSILLVC